MRTRVSYVNTREFSSTPSMIAIEHTDISRNVVSDTGMLKVRLRICETGTLGKCYFARTSS